MLRRSPKRFFHLQKSTWYTAVGNASKGARTLLSHFGVSMRWCSFVSIYQPRTVFLVDQAAPPLTELLQIDRLLKEAVCGLVCPEDCVDAHKTLAEHLAHFLGAALAVGDKILHIDVYTGQGVHLLIRGGSRPLVVVGMIGHLLC